MGTIAVQGSGTATSPPDVADIAFMFVTAAKTSGEAVADNSEQMAKLLEIVKGFGVEKKHVRTTNFNVSPIWDRVKKGAKVKITGHQAANQVVMRLMDITKLGDLLAALAEEGVTNLSHEWDIEDKSKLENKARIAAYKSARDKAETYAREAKVTLGKVNEVTESQAWARAKNPMRGGTTVMCMGAPEPVPMAEGEQAVTVQVQTSFLFD